MLYTIGEKDGQILTATAEEIIGNALDQERAGVRPTYSFYDYKNQEIMTPPGWLVWSSRNYGCGVVYRRKKDGKLIITTGSQGDFVCS